MNAGSSRGAQLAVLANRFERIVRKMTNTLFRTARSGVINTARDFSCCIVTGVDELLAVAESIPIMIVSGPELITRYMKDTHPRLRRGDAFLHNSPYHGGSHAADHCVVVPVIDDDGRLRFSVLVKAHVADCGNAVPSSLVPHARDVYEEGALIFPCVKLQERYKDIDAVVRMCEMRIRAPSLWRGDLRAMVGAARIGERELLELGNEVGFRQLEDHVDEWLAYSSERMAAAIKDLPAGSSTVTTMHDAFPGLAESVPIRASVTVDHDRTTVVVDLRDNPDCLPNAMNLTEATARACAIIGVLNSIPANIPVNAGSISRIDVRLRENCAVGIPRHPASCSLATTHPAIRTINAVQRALAELGDGIGMAESGSAIPAGGAAISGVDPRRGGAPFVGLLFFGLSGGAASPFADGWLGADSNTAGMMNSDSIELDELHYPLRIWRNRVVPDSEGAGRRRGAPSRLVEWEPVGAPLTAHWMSDGDVNPALGARGGRAGSLAAHWLCRRSGRVDPLPAVGSTVIEPGERLVSTSSSGGGYGPPDQRERERVLRDVAEGWISRERARTVYGLSVDETVVLGTQRHL